MKVLWQGLSERDRRALITAVVAILAAAYYGLLWEPLHDHVARQQIRVDTARATLVEIQDARRRLGAMSATASGGGQIRGSLLAHVDASLKRAQLSDAVKRVDPRADGSVQLWLNDARFARAVTWLNQLSRDGVQVVALDATRGNVDGIASLRLTIR